MDLQQIVSQIGPEIWSDIVFDGHPHQFDEEIKKQLRRFFSRRLMNRITDSDCQDCVSYCWGYNDSILHLIEKPISLGDIEQKSSQIHLHEYTRGWFSAKQDAMILLVKPSTKPQPRKINFNDNPQQF